MEILGYRSLIGSLGRRLAGGFNLLMPAALVLVMAFANGLTAGTPGQPIDEYQVKAAFIYNFARFVTWPARSFIPGNDAIAICIAGRDPFGHWMEDTVSGHTIDGRRLTVQHIGTAAEANSCHILFVGSDDDKRSLSALRENKMPGILTIGESSAAEDAGVMVNFRLEGGKVRFDINLRAAYREKLQISSRLLSLAQMVRK